MTDSDSVEKGYKKFNKELDKELARVKLNSYKRYRKSKAYSNT